MAALANGTIVGERYRLNRELARGGMGSVWSASDEKLKRPVAIKLMSGDYSASDDARTRFENEAMAVAKLSSPHVVQVFDFGIHTDPDASCYPYIVMELLEGEDLRRRLLRRKRLSLDEAGDLMAQVGKALSEAHALGIVHRDLKPGNIFLVRQREEELIKVLDFGVAKTSSVAHDTLDADTKEGALLGTPQFMSPEQARGITEVDQRADLWSLGVILYRVLTGKLPYDGINVADIIVRLCTDSFVPATQVAPDLPPHIDSFFARALARDVEKRFPNARQMAMAFSRHAPVSMPSLSMPAPRPSLARKQEAVTPPPLSAKVPSRPRPPAMPPVPSLKSGRPSRPSQSGLAPPAPPPSRPMPPPRPSQPRPAQAKPSTPSSTSTPTSKKASPEEFKPPRKTVAGHRSPGVDAKNWTGSEKKERDELSAVRALAANLEQHELASDEEATIAATGIQLDDDFFDDDAPTQVGPRLLRPSTPPQGDAASDHFSAMATSAPHASKSTGDELLPQGSPANGIKDEAGSSVTGPTLASASEPQEATSSNAEASANPSTPPSTLGGGTLETERDGAVEESPAAHQKSKRTWLIVGAAALTMLALIASFSSLNSDPEPPAAAGPKPTAKAAGPSSDATSKDKGQRAPAREADTATPARSQPELEKATSATPASSSEGPSTSDPPATKASESKDSTEKSSASPQTGTTKPAAATRPKKKYSKPVTKAPAGGKRPPKPAVKAAPPAPKPKPAAPKPPSGDPFNERL